MTTLYRPVLIETTEQAEALAQGIVLIRDDHYAFQEDKGRFVSADPHDLPVAHAWEVVGWTALVPVEAEEEFQDIDAYEASGHMRRHHLARYTTPWEEVS